MRDIMIRRIVDIGMTVLVIVHQILNRKWYSAVFKGTYNPYRLMTTAVIYQEMPDKVEVNCQASVILRLFLITKALTAANNAAAASQIPAIHIAASEKTSSCIMFIRLSLSG